MDETFQGLLRTTTVMLCNHNLHLYSSKSKNKIPLAQKIIFETSTLRLVMSRILRTFFRKLSTFLSYDISCKKYCLCHMIGIYIPIELGLVVRVRSIQLSTHRHSNRTRDTACRGKRTFRQSDPLFIFLVRHGSSKVNSAALLRILTCC